MITSTIELFKEEMKFSAGHFTIFGPGQRENMHGHNFTVFAALEGIVRNGMVVDYGPYKRMIIERCRLWNETFLLPAQSPHLQLDKADNGDVTAHFGDERFTLLGRDVTVLPASNITLEELARLLGENVVGDSERMRSDGIIAITIKCGSGPGQWASWRWSST
jgi:6-pyruvoyltetrahydropterin/6-carboxytetrahydropterin synthase